MDMFCFQCEQTAHGTGCTTYGVCGKSPEIAALQDLLIEISKEIASLASCSDDKTISALIQDALFTTVTNVNFDDTRMVEEIKKAVACRDKILAAGSSCGCAPANPIQVPDNLEGMLELAKTFSIQSRRQKLGETPAGLQELALYGLKGAVAYSHHARLLGFIDEKIDADVVQVMATLAGDPVDIGELLGLALSVGELNLRIMELLDRANTETYGHPEPTTVRVTPIAGKCILVSGHDLRDLELILQQSEGKGINVYTHGEMLPCLAYPGLKKYAHLVGNYGGAWQDQKKEFAAFPGPIVMTTNCIQKPREDYIGRIFTTDLVAWPGVPHIGPDKDFSPVIEAALTADGFAADEPAKEITIGFARQAVLNVAGAVVDAVKAGAIKHFFLVGGCDGAKSGRNYFTEFAQAVPDDCIILTLACGKYRFNKLDFGDIGGIPRLLDVGQCNDAYSAVQITVALADAFECGINDLPLSMIISWYEQKAVAILLTLLHLGIQNIKLGPTLPAFITPDVLGVLVDKFKIAPTTTAQEDLDAILAT